MIKEDKILLLKQRAKSIQTSISAKKKSISDTEFLISMRNQEIEARKKDNEELQKTMELFKFLSEQENERSKQLFISLVNHGLEAIFGSDTQFDLDRKQYATGTFYFPVLVKDGKREAIFSSGGGVLDIVSFLCRIVVIVSFYPVSSRVLKLDEPFKNLSAEYREKAALLIEKLCSDFNIQLIMVTHEKFLKELKGSCLFKAEKVDNVTSYTKL